MSVRALQLFPVPHVFNDMDERGAAGRGGAGWATHHHCGRCGLLLEPGAALCRNCRQHFPAPVPRDPEADRLLRARLRNDRIAYAILAVALASALIAFLVAVSS